MCSNPTIFQFYHTFYLKPLPLSPPTPTMFSVPKRNTGTCFQRPVNILRGLQRYCKNLRAAVVAAAAAGALTLWF